MNDRTRVLVTGAAGRIGSAFVTEMRDRYDFRLADKTERVHELLPEVESLVLDAADYGACVRAVQGIDVVLHLAADPSPAADYYQSLQPSNFDATYNVFKAASDAGCARVVYASSVQTVLGYQKDDGTKVDAAWWPLNMYAVSKCYGEATARMFAATTDLSAICVRIGAYQRPGLDRPETRRELSAYVSPRDLNQLFRLCIEAEGIEFAVVHGVSNNQVNRLSLTETRELLGYEPVDDGFTVYGVPLDEW
ncbi:MAG: NAD(P)-dependent oxidoreductase [Thermomicrobiales bacterium]|nr:MAG: NAD(P)-dependent oxidoreductase [Thermomicrobiales bacterium]